jgi:F0F1-type ATP synthase assembly protein I
MVGEYPRSEDRPIMMVLDAVCSIGLLLTFGWLFWRLSAFHANSLLLGGVSVLLGTLLFVRWAATIHRVAAAMWLATIGFAASGIVRMCAIGWLQL